MYAKAADILSGFRLSQQYRPALRYAFGATFIMGLAMATGNQLAYLIPLLSLSFFAPGTTQPTLKTSIGFVIIVALSSLFGYAFTSAFYDYKLTYIPLLALLLFWIFYTDRISPTIKLFLLISLLATPVPQPGINTKVWAKILAEALTFGAILTVIVVWLVYAMFPDLEDVNKAGKKKIPMPGKDFRFQNALETLIVTFPVVLLFIFYQGGNALLVLIYIVILALLPRGMGVMAGKGKIYGNIIGGIITIAFYEILTVVPLFFFFLLLFLGTALVFAGIIFSDKPYAGLFKTGFSTLVLIIGSTTSSTSDAANEIYIRVFQVMMAVLYVVVAYYILDAIRLKRTG